MISRISAFLMMLFLVLIVQNYPFGEYAGGAFTVIALGFVMLAGYLLGEMLAGAKLPRISGYLFAGIFLGPYMAGILTKETVSDLALIDSIALSLIALTAGGELHLHSLKKNAKAIGSICIFQTAGTLALMIPLFYFLAQILPFWSGIPAAETLGAALIVSVIAVSQSPATTIAVINEVRAKGDAANIALGVTILIDIFVIFLFTITLSLLSLLEKGAPTFPLDQFLALGSEFLFSILAGILYGIGISLYLRYINANQLLFILAFSYLVSLSAKTLHLDSILVCLFAGAWVTNASKRGEELIHMIEKGSVIVYVIFFCVAGASLNLYALNQMKWIALILVAGRMASLALTTWAGITFSRAPIQTASTYWMAFLPQAGVSLGLLSIFNQRDFSWTPTLYTLILACIALNQILGPITMKYALQKTGETQDTGER